MVKRYTGIVYKSTGSWYDVKLEDNKFVQCRVVGKLRLGSLKTTNPVTVGDRVEVNLIEEHEGQISKVLPRINYVVRQSPRKKHNVHLLAANVDQVFLLVTIINPTVKTGFIDRFLMMTEPYNIPTTIVFNKCDLYKVEDINRYNELVQVYNKIGYNVMMISAKSKTGLTELTVRLKDKTTLIAGQSGVGKSSLINVLHDQVDLLFHIIGNDGMAVSGCQLPHPFAHFVGSNSFRLLVRLLGWIDAMTTRTIP